MNTSQALEVVNRIFNAVFGQPNHYSIHELKDKFAFDVILPLPVQDCITGKTTYTAMPNADKYIAAENSRQKKQCE